MSRPRCDCLAGDPCTCAPRPAEPTGELREQEPGRAVASSQMECDIAEVLHTHKAVTWADALELADALLSGPLAPLLAKLRAVEALQAELAAERPSDHPLIAALANRLRRALDGT